MKVWIICQEKDYHGSYLMTTNKIHNRGLCCPYCEKRKIHPLDSLGALYPQVIPLWSSKNKKSPFSDKKCANGFYGEEFFHRKFAFL